METKCRWTDVLTMDRQTDTHTDGQTQMAKVKTKYPTTSMWVGGGGGYKKSWFFFYHFLYKRKLCPLTVPIPKFFRAHL